MSHCPTYRLKNVRTGEVVVANQSDYNSPFRTGTGRFQSVLLGGDWEIVSENHRGGDEGYRKSAENIDIMVGVEMKREKDNIGARK
jgi:hypothetical protein